MPQYMPAYATMLNNDEAFPALGKAPQHVNYRDYQGPS